MFDFKQDLVLFSYNFEINFFVLKFFHVWCCQKMTLIFQKYFLEKTSLLSHHIMRKDKKREKKGIPPFFCHTRNNSWKKITPYPSQYHLIELLYFSNSLKLHIKKNPSRDKCLRNILTPVLSSPSFF